MQPVLLIHQLVNCFTVIFIIHATINRANGSALRFFMKKLALCKFVWNDVINIVCN